MAAPIISKDALAQAMSGALASRGENDRHGLTDNELRKLVDILYSHALDSDSADMKKEIESLIDAIVKGA